MKQKSIKSPSKAPQSEEDLWVNVHDRELMIELGIHPPYAIPRDPSVWTKTSHEKQLLKSERRKFKGKIHFQIVPQKSIPVRAKLIIYLKKNKKFPNTTYSTECWQHEIDSILSRYWIKDTKTGLMKCLISKYTYNGKTYSPKERPFWFGN